METDLALADNVTLTSARAENFQIKNAEDYKDAGAEARNIKTLMEQVKATFDPICEKAHAAHKEATAQRERHFKPLDRALSFLKNKMAAYNQIEQDRIAAEHRVALAKAEAEAREARE